MSGYAAKLIMHLKFAGGGFSFKYELTDFPGIFVFKTKESHDKPVEQEIVYANITYSKFAEAVEMWRRDHQKPEDANV